jgi:hypothetical protein
MTDIDVIKFFTKYNHIPGRYSSIDDKDHLRTMFGALSVSKEFFLFVKDLCFYKIDRDGLWLFAFDSWEALAKSHNLFCKGLHSKASTKCLTY